LRTKPLGRWCAAAARSPHLLLGLFLDIAALELLDSLLDLADAQHQLRSGAAASPPAAGAARPRGRGANREARAPRSRGKDRGAGAVRALPQSVRHGGRAAHDRAGLDTLRDARLSADHRALADVDVAHQPCLSTERDVILELGAARDADLSDDDAMLPDHDVVADLHQIVDLGAVTDPRAV